MVQLTDAVDWAPELQVTLDVIRGGDPIGSGRLGQAVPLYASNADFVFQVSMAVSWRWLHAANWLHSNTAQGHTATEKCAASLLLRQGQHGAPRLAGAAFLECLDALFHRSTGGQPLEVRWYGKPSASTYRYAEQMLEAEASRLGLTLPVSTRLWGVGDNPAADIRGANNAGERWRSALVKTVQPCPQPSRVLVHIILLP